MSTHSTDGREWARLSKLKPGAVLKCDDGFTCGIAGKEVLVGRDKNGFFVGCDGGEEEHEARQGTGKFQCKHYLDGQTCDEDGDHLVGMWPA